MESNLQVYEGEVHSLVPVDMVKELAKRLEATYVQPKKPEDHILPKEFETVVEIALAEGHNPLSKTFWFWKFRGKLAITGAYTNLVNWAQKAEPFTFTHEMLSIGRGDQKGPGRQDFHCRLWLLKRGDQQAYQDRFDSVMKHRQQGEPIVDFIKQAKEYAQELCFMGEGVVEWGEVFYPDGNTLEQVKGWVPGETRAQRRALKNAIRQAFGEPSPGERRALSLAALSEAKRYLSVPKEIVKVGQANRFLELEDNVDRFREEIKAESIQKDVPEAVLIHNKRNKNVEQMRGYDSIRDDILGTEPVEASFEEEKPFDFTTRMDEIGLGDTKKIKALAKGLFNKPVEELSDLEKWNIYQFSKRVQHMTPGENEGYDENDLARTIPELCDFKGQTFVEAKNILGAKVRELTTDGQRLQELSFEFE